LLQLLRTTQDRHPNTKKEAAQAESRMALKVLIILLSLFVSGLLVGNELAVAVFIHPVLYSVSDEEHVRVAKPLAMRFGRSMPFWYALSLVFAILQMLIMRAAPSAILLALKLLFSQFSCRLQLTIGSRDGISIDYQQIG
jgi:hypothetical protein